ncbi:MAG: DUF4390 domain-containing protein [Rubrivivax sp.]
MNAARTALQPPPLPGQRRGVGVPMGAWLLALLVLLAMGSRPSAAQGVELTTLNLVRSEAALEIEFAARVKLPRTVEDAMQRGVPVWFTAEAQLMRKRWYWRDDRVARVSRQWRIAYQPLTGTWRVALGGLNQTFASLPEALLAASRSAGWKLADAGQIDPDSRYYVEFSYKLDTSQLPAPMSFGLGAGGADWVLGVQRELRVE